MKSLKGLVFRYIWKNKLRTTMTIVAITIASFIIFGLFLLGYTYMLMHMSWKANGMQVM